MPRVKKEPTSGFARSSEEKQDDAKPPPLRVDAKTSPKFFDTPPPSPPRETRQQTYKDNGPRFF